MASDINSVMLVGRLTRDAESKTIGTSFLSTFSIAVNRRAKDANDNWSDEANFFDIEFWGKQAEAIIGFLKKGKQIAIVGSLKHSRWEQDGQKRSKVTITAQNVQLLGSASSGQNMSDNSAITPQATSHTTPQNSTSSEGFDDDIPF